jgi:hypothetical protein
MSLTGRPVAGLLIKNNPKEVRQWDGGARFLEKKPKIGSSNL